MAQSRTPLAPTVRISSALHSRPAAVVDAALDAADTAADTSTDLRVVETGPTGHPALAPLVLATLDGQTAFLPNCDPATAAAAVAALGAGELPENAAFVADHDPERSTVPTPAGSPLAVGTRRVLGPCGWVDPTDPADYGALVSDDTDDGHDVYARARQIGLLGRGRGDGSTDDPIADTWDTTVSAEDDPVVIVNAHEADDRVLADRMLLDAAPIAVLDAATAVADVVDATDVIVYLDEADDRLSERVRAAVEEFDADTPIQTVTGPDRYIAGEMTMALEVMEGNDRIEARIRPPSPAEHGLHGRPTVIHTPRTLAQLRHALLHPDEFDPDDADPGTRTVTVTGDVDAPATVELPTGGSLDTAREAARLEAADPAFACVGGQFGGFTRDLDVPPSAPALAAADLGTNGVVELFDDSHCIVATAGSRVSFAKSENCGRCVPCREGSKQLVSLLRDIYRGDFDAANIRELARVMQRSSTCGFGRDAARTVSTALDRFETDFRAHANGRCPSGTCDSL